MVRDPGWVWSVWEGAHLTFQSDDCGAIEVQQSGQGTAVCVVLQQVLHQGERGSAPLVSVLFPIASLKDKDTLMDTSSVTVYETF